MAGDRPERPGPPEPPSERPPERSPERVFASRDEPAATSPSRVLAAALRAPRPAPPAPPVRSAARPGPPGLRVEPVGEDDRAYVAARTASLFGDETVVSRGVLHRPAELSGVIAWEGSERVGHATLRFDGLACELVTVEAEAPGRGVGRALVERVERTARYTGAQRLWLVTTNDNVGAQAFYERLGFSRVAVHEGAVDESRRLKPAIPERGEGGVPIRDEIEYERRFRL